MDGREEGKEFRKQYCTEIAHAVCSFNCMEFPARIRFQMYILSWAGEEIIFHLFKDSSVKILVEYWVV